jgi:hypothetical protein
MVSFHRFHHLLLLYAYRLWQKGCVRFWDVRRSADDIQNGDVLAQPNSDIGHFSVGDPRNGEKPLVVWVYPSHLKSASAFTHTYTFAPAVTTEDAFMYTTTQLPAAPPRQYIVWRPREIERMPADTTTEVESRENIK